VGSSPPHAATQCDAPVLVADVDGVPVCDAEMDAVSELDADTDDVPVPVDGGDSVREGVPLQTKAQRVGRKERGNAGE
jgi:hypothetical protein